MRKTILSLSAAALALGGAGAAIADHHGAKRGPMAADTDGNGVITLAEVRAQGAERFAKMDVNGDGSLSAADREARRAANFAKADTNGDGELSQAEMTAAREARQAHRAERRAERRANRLERLDTDNSGGLSQAELEAGKKARAEARGEGRRGEGKMHRGKRGKRGGGMHMLRMADANGDKIVTRAEFDAAIAARFAKVDTDGSGTITAEERAAHKAKMKENRGKRGDRPGS